MTRFALAASVFVLGLVVPVSAQPGNDNRAPDLGDCEEIAVPAGHKVAFHAYAAGVQVYKWTGAAWTLDHPEAYLFADAGGHGVIGIHYAGPKWQANDGSIVAGAVDVRCPVAGSIPWLKLIATPDPTTPGLFSRTTYIQRVNTTGGVAPSEPGEFVGDEARIPYTAEYYFYRKQS